MSARPNLTLAGLQRLAPKADPAIIGTLAADPTPLEEAGVLAHPLRLCHFLAQAAHETAGFTTLVERGGRAYFTRLYGARRDLGNREPADGPRFRGRGIFQLTGRRNYRTYGRFLGLDLEAAPDRAAEPTVSLRVACEYWRRHRLNSLADANDLIGITRRINGGRNGLAARGRLFRQALEIFAPASSTGTGGATVLLRIGSCGRAVKRLQRRLVAHGHAVLVDGLYGRQTERALIAFQRASGLSPDGVFGPRSKAALRAHSPSQQDREKESPMDQWKSYLQSRTIWANLIGFGALALSAFGFHGLTGDEQAHLVDALLKLVEAGGFIAGVVFRAVARDRLGPTLF